MKGRLHTRYAPVRRSLESKLSIPLDLHVLSLPLAFILSQDQTLHRILCESNKFDSIYFWLKIYRFFQIYRFYYSLFFCSNISVKTAVNSICLGTCLILFLVSFFTCYSVSRSGCKSKTCFLNWQENFEVFFKKYYYLLTSGFLINLSRNFARFAGCKYN